MEDIRFVAIQERNFLILKAICDHVDPELFEFYRQRYNQDDFFNSYIKGTSMKGHMDGRFGTTRFMNLKANRIAQDETGLVGYQEQFSY